MDEAAKSSWPRLRQAHGRLWDALWGSDAELDAAVEAVAEALLEAEDLIEAVGELDDMVTAQLDQGLRIALDSGQDRDALGVRLYAACIEDLYTGLDWPFPAADTRLQRGQLALDLNLLDEAETLLREAATALDEDQDFHAGTPWHLLGEALRRQHRNAEAVEAYARAAEISAACSAHGQAAESFDALAGLTVTTDPERAATAFERAAGHWRHVEEHAEADESEILAGRAAVELLSGCDAADTERRERFARKAFEIGRRLDDDALAAMGALQLGLVHLERLDAAPAIDVLQFGVESCERLTDRSLQALTLGMLAVAQLLRPDLAAAEHVIRRALALADHLEDQDFVDLLVTTLASLTQSRADLTTAQQLIEVVQGRLIDQDLAFLRDQKAIMERLAAEDVSGMHELAERMVARAGDDPRSAEHAAFALGILILMDAAAQDGATATARLAQLDRIVQLARTDGDRFGARGLELVMPLYRALAALARGDRQVSIGELERWHGELLAGRGGSSALAARAAALLGFVHGESGRADSAVAWLVPAVVFHLREFSLVPSSSERAAIRRQLDGAVAAALRAIAATGDAVLLSEFLETIRSQSMPDPVDDSPDQTRSVAALVTLLIPGRLGTHQDWIEQETSMSVPPRVVMPWGRIALEHVDEQVARYAPGPRSSPGLVRLQVPR